MQITEVRIKLMENSEDRLRGFCSVTFDDCFVVRDLKIIEGNNGPFVAMPSRKLSANCHKCRTKNHLRARFCNHCGARLRGESIGQDSDGRARLYADIAHPVNASCREMIQSHVIKEFLAEVELSQQPGYVSRYDEDYDDDWNSSDSRRNYRENNTGGSPEAEQEPDPMGRDTNQRVDPGDSSVTGGHSGSEAPTRPPSEQAGSGPDTISGFGKGILD